MSNEVITYRNRSYTIDETSIIEGTGEGFAFARNSRNEFVMLLVIVREGQIVRAAIRREPWEDVA